MKELLSKEALEYWNSKASEPMHFEPYPEDIQKEMDKKLPPIPSKKIMEAYAETLRDILGM